MADDTDSGVLTTRQFNGIAALMSEPTVRKACEAAGIPERTMYKWLKSPAFVEEYRQARRAAVQQAIGRLQQVSGVAVAVLVNLMSSSPPATKLGAARTILEFAVKAVELEDLAARLDELERRYAKEF